MKNKILLGSAITLILTGCSVMPYHDNFMCQGGSNVHICKRVSDVYLESDNLNLSKKFYKATVKKTKQIDYKILKENKELKNIIEAISYNELKNPVEVKIIKEYNSTHTINGMSIKTLNRNVRVCVLNANIRKEPSCQAKIVKVAHKNQELYAYYIKGAWIKVKDGYIHKSLVCEECKEVR